MSNTKEHLRSISDARRRIRDKIDLIEKKLKYIENVPSSNPWISKRVVQTIEELASSTHYSLRDALIHDINILKSKLRDLDREAMNVRIQGAQRARRNFRSETLKTLKEAENKGGLSDSEMASLLVDAEKVLKRFVDILNANPSEKNIGNVLGSLGSPLHFGADSESGVSGEAFRALKRASEILVDQKEKTFRRNPTEENFVGLLNSKSNAMRLGGNIQVITQPSDLKLVHTTYVVKLGDSISSISQKYYGNAGYWDVIYFRNMESLAGIKPNNLPVGITLHIP
jgi:hypothetical protein